MRLFALACALSVLAAWSCRSKPAPEPVEVVRLWQRYLDYNKFDSARLYSTELARAYVDHLDALVGNDVADVYPITLYNLKCNILGDSAVCHYLIEGELGERIPDTLILYKINGCWLVHRVEGFVVNPVDSLLPGEENLLFPGDTLDVELE